MRERKRDKEIEGERETELTQLWQVLGHPVRMQDLEADSVN